MLHYRWLNAMKCFYGFKYRTQSQERLDLCLSLKSGRVSFTYIYFLNIIVRMLGSQLREWLLFFSLPVLTGKLPRDYLKHFSLLIAALHILLADTISPVDLSNAEFPKGFLHQTTSVVWYVQCILCITNRQSGGLIRVHKVYTWHNICLNLQCSSQPPTVCMRKGSRRLPWEWALFLDTTVLCLGPNATTHKVHLLSQAVACVRRWGPLWAYSTFHFEGMNHQVKKLFHGSQDMNKQVCN